MILPGESSSQVICVSLTDVVKSLLQMHWIDLNIRTY